MAELGLADKARVVFLKSEEDGAREVALGILREPVRPTAFFAGHDELALGVLTAVADLGLTPSDVSVVGYDDTEIAVVNCAGELFAIEDRCSHDDGPLAEGCLDEQACTLECPRHGSLFDLRTGIPKSLPAY